uniref:SAC domain-containing protein n=1 Tax=Glossina palpalis gambiensis TaxID=67801 RepID=A0A1B0BH87_9MUSC
MEVFQTDNYYIFVKRGKSLWWNRQTSEFTIKAGWDLSSVDDIECIGITHGIVGVISLPNVYESHLVIVKEAIPVGVLYPPHLVYRIKSICILSSDEPDAVLITCTRHNRNANTTPNQTQFANGNNSNANNASSLSLSSSISTTSSSTRPKLFEGNQLMNKTWGAVKSAGNTIKNTTQQAAALASNQVKSSVGIRDPTRIEKRITEELHKIFDDTDSFYFCFDHDITNNLQRHLPNGSQDEQTPDERFFWNMHMIKDIVQLNDKTWILPIIQGFVQVEPCVIGNEYFTLALVSRRSRHRAGTRYKRRGVDENGNCANYVETEQILSFRHHQLSFSIVRGSVPIYWSQPGYKYRPPPRLDKALAHEAGAMGFHWRDQRGIICNQRSVFRVNCMDCLDRTNVVQTALGKAVLESQLVKLGLAPPYTPIPEQLKSPFMVLWANNGDIISRQYAGTNALKVSSKLKLSRRRAFKVDLHFQGDYTRTGERKISGMMKDGMNSANRFFIQNFTDTFRQCIIDLMQGQLNNANELKEDEVLSTILLILCPSVPAPTRGYFYAGVLGPEIKLLDNLLYTRYYLARFKDSYRQATIDLMLGNQVSAESLNALGGQAAPDEHDALEGVEHAKSLVEDCRRLLLGSAQYPVGAWGLIDANPGSGDINETEVDSILLLTDECYIVAEYDSHLDKIVRFEKVLLENVTMIELGMYHQTKIFQSSTPGILCLRINYKIDNAEGYFHMFRSANIRFFNNMAYIIKTSEEIAESFHSIVEMFRISLESAGYTDVKFSTGGVLPRRKSKIPLLEVPKGMPRNLSESQLVQISSKAFSNVAGQFSKLGHSLNPHKNKKPSHEVVKIQTRIDKCVEATEKPVFMLGKALNSTSGSDSEENDSSLYEPELDSDTELVISAAEKANFNEENNFLPSVGIVMGKASGENQVSEPSSGDIGPLMDKDSGIKHVEDVLSLSISSVATHVTLPTGLLENAAPIRPITPNPQICIQDDTGNIENFISSSNANADHSSNEHSRSSSPKDLRLTMEAGKLRQLKSMTSPLTKIAKGVQNIGMNLDPRKIASKGNVLSPTSSSAESSPPERHQGNKMQLEEMWREHKCNTKLIAL